jgi:hypothetical protein
MWKPRRLITLKSSTNFNFDSFTFRTQVSKVHSKVAHQKKVHTDDASSTHFREQSLELHCRHFPHNPSPDSVSIPLHPPSLNAVHETNPRDLRWVTMVLNNLLQSSIFKCSGTLNRSYATSKTLYCCRGTSHAPQHYGKGANIGSFGTQQNYRKKRDCWS